MTTYTIYLEATPIANTDGAEYTSAVWSKTKDLANLINASAALVADDTGEEIDCFEPEPLEEVEIEEDEWEEPDWGDEGFDPYCGCYTGDC